MPLNNLLRAPEAKRSTAYKNEQVEILLSGNAILYTDHGTKRAEDITDHDRLISRDLGLVGISKVNSERSKQKVCQILKNAIGPNVPNANTELLGQQVIVVRNYSAVPMQNTPVNFRRVQDIHHMIPSKMHREKNHTLVSLHLKQSCIVYVNQLEVRVD